MGKLQFMNQDGEWENFPTDEELAYYRANIEALEQAGFALVCQMCNKTPNRSELQLRMLKHEWTCSVCHTVNSAGRA